MITYNTILKTFNEIADTHIGIQNFGNGAMEDINIFNKDDKFPVLWVIPQRVTLGQNSMIYTIRVMVFDIAESDDSIDDELLSDTILILNDVMMILNSTPFWNNEEASVVNTPSALPFRQKFVDYCIGWYADMDIEVPSFNGSGYCQVND